MIPKKFKDFAHTNNGLNARPCFIKEVAESLEELLKEDFIFKKNLIEDYKSIFINYLNSDPYNKLEGLKEFSFGTYTHGTIQAFEDFYSRHSNKRLRWFEGDFAYHQIASRSYGFCGEIINDLDDLKFGDSFVISVPFSASCKVNDQIEEILNICEKESIPVLLDFAYLPISRNIKINLNYETIDSICFSLSKCYFGIERLRTGLRLRRDYKDDPTDFFNEFSMFNHAGAYVGMNLLMQYPPSDIVNMLAPIYERLCKENNYEMNNTVLFSSLNKTHHEYEFYKRGNSVYSRKCLSEMIAELI
tara:strand:+ start:1538 stop:2446 length:909 start_codon:yes stop_codon:yes gene_type:complete